MEMPELTPYHKPCASVMDRIHGNTEPGVSWETYCLLEIGICVSELVWCEVCLSKGIMESLTLKKTSKISSPSIDPSPLCPLNQRRGRLPVFPFRTCPKYLPVSIK